MENDTKLKPGDCVYYDAHHALGLLIERYRESTHGSMGQWRWRYVLRSPKRSDLENHLVSIQHADETMFLEGIKTGRLVLYGC